MTKDDYDFVLEEHEQELLEALMKVAVGGEYTDTVSTVRNAGTEQQAAEQEKSRRQVEPNADVAQYLLGIIDERKYAKDKMKMREMDMRAWDNGMPVEGGVQW